MILLAVLPVFIAICLAVYALVGSAEEKATIRESLRQLGGYEIENQRDRDLLNPLRERAVLPVVNWFTGLGRRLTPVGYVDGIRRKLTPCAPWTSGSTCRRCGRSCSPSSRPTRSASPSAACSGSKPTRCASSAVSWPRSRPSRLP